ncbi:hypothetical protein [Bradyrhizobium sp. USDA 3364]
MNEFEADDYDKENEQYWQHMFRISERKRGAYDEQSRKTIDVRRNQRVRAQCQRRIGDNEEAQKETPRQVSRHGLRHSKWLP